MNRYKVGTQAFIIESNRLVRSVVIIKISDGFYTVKFNDSNGAINVKESRIFDSKEAAKCATCTQTVFSKTKSPKPPHKIW